MGGGHLKIGRVSLTMETVPFRMMMNNAISNSSHPLLSGERLERSQGVAQALVGPVHRGARRRHPRGHLSPGTVYQPCISKLSNGP